MGMAGNDVTNLLLTGRPGIGKSTALQRTLPLLTDLRVSGFVTEEIREGGQRVGFRAASLTGVARVMARRGLVSPHRVGNYGVDVLALDDVLLAALEEGVAADVFLVDEIGKMELASARFVAAVIKLLADPRPLVATIAQRGSGLIADAVRRPDVEVWQVDYASRDDLPGRVAAWIRGRRSS